MNVKIRVEPVFSKVKVTVKLKGESENQGTRLDKPARLSFSCSLDLLLNERREL